MNSTDNILKESTSDPIIEISNLQISFDKHEVLTEQETSNFLNLILGEKGNTQL